MSWSTNNKAHAASYLVAHYLCHKRQPGLPEASFVEVGAWPNSRVIDHTTGESSEHISSKAGATAGMLDEFFTSFFGALPEPGKTRGQAISAMQSQLSKVDDPYGVIGDIVDSHYRFVGEI